MAETKTKAAAKTAATKTTKTTAKSAATQTKKTQNAKTEEKPAAKPVVRTVKAETKVEEKPVVKAEVKVEKKAEKTAKNVKTLTIKLVKSPNGRLDKQKKTLIALGLRKIGDESQKPDNAQIRGMIFVVKHLVSVKEN